MNLLPKTEIDFTKTEYWDKFFKERGSKEFEWYGEYIELCGELHNYLKKEDTILVVGCGNSMLSSDLFDVGYRNLTSIDISSIVIKQMKNKVGRDRPELIFEEMDALNMSYENESYSVVIDKGTLDALMPNDSQEDRERAQKLFSEISRVLKLNGRYIIISLLQSHILKEILKFFTDQGWMIRIMRCWDVEKKKINETGCLTMPVFMVICVKLKKTKVPLSILEVNIFVNRKLERVKTQEEVMEMIEGVQKTTFNYREAKAEVEIKFCRSKNEEPRYFIFVVDSSKDQRKLLKYAAFIVPHGRETEWMFGTPEGRRYLRESTGFDRLAVIHFSRKHEYGTMEEIQDELRQTILQLAPCCLPSGEGTPQVPYLTLGEGVGYRKTIFTGNSQYSGDLVVEEVEVEGDLYRRLVFLSNQAVVQSEVKLKKVPSKNNKGEKKKIIDFTHVASDHILYMSIPAAIIKSTNNSKSPSIAVIGLGGGGLCLFLHKVFPSAVITGVEIDPLVVQVAKDHFGFNVNDRLKVVIKDGVEFLKEKQNFDIVMFDVDSKEQGSAMSSPPKVFLEPETLEAVAHCLGNTGVFVINVVSRVNSEHEKLIQKCKKYFPVICWYNLKEDVNRIVFCTRNENFSSSEWQRHIKEAAVSLNKCTKDKLKTTYELLDINHLIKELNI